MEGEVFEKINQLTPNDYLFLATDDAGTNRESFKYRYEKQPTKYAWDIYC